MRKVSIITWVSNHYRALWNYGSWYHCHLIRLYCRIALCIHLSLFPLFLSLVSLSLLPLYHRHHSLLSRGFRNVRNTWQYVHTHSLAAPTAIPFGLSETWTGKSPEWEWAFRCLKHTKQNNKIQLIFWIQVSIPYLWKNDIYVPIIIIIIIMTVIYYV